MTYCAVLEIYGALENGRFDSGVFHESCAKLYTVLQSTSSKDVTWFLSAYYVYAESNNESSLFRWVSKLCDMGFNKETSSDTFPWILRGFLLDGSLGIEAVQSGLTINSSSTMFPELQTSLNNFHSIGVKVGYVPESAAITKHTISNIYWTAHKDIPYSLFLDVRPSLQLDLVTSRIEQLTKLAMKTARYSKTQSRYYVSAISRLLLHAQNSGSDVDIDELITILSKAKNVDGIELLGLLLVNEVFANTDYDQQRSEQIVEFPKLNKLCMALQEKHAFPLGIVNKVAVKRFIKELQKH